MTKNTQKPQERESVAQTAKEDRERYEVEQKKREKLDLPVTTGVYLTQVIMPDSSTDGMRARGVKVGESLWLIKDPSKKYISVLDDDDRIYEGTGGLKVLWDRLKAESRTPGVDPQWAQNMLADVPTSVAPAAPVDSAEADAVLAAKLKLSSK